MGPDLIPTNGADIRDEGHEGEYHGNTAENFLVAQTHKLFIISISQT